MDFKEITSKKTDKENIPEKLSFLLTNKAGGYISLSSSPVSRFQGVFFSESPSDGLNAPEILKVIEDIKLEGSEPSSMTKSFWNVTRTRANLKESFFMPYNNNALVYELNDYGTIDLILDIKHPYDNREFGRYYEISKEGNKLIIKFTKLNDPREKGNDEKEYGCFLVVNSKDMEVQEVNKWIARDYSLDRSRNSIPFQRHVFHAARINAKRLIFSFSYHENKAIKKADYILKNLDYLKVKQENHIKKISHVKDSEIRISDFEVLQAYKCSINAIDTLITDKEKKLGIYAGLWWFFQFWSRDEAVSCGALINNENYDDAKKILFRILKNSSRDGVVKAKDEGFDNTNSAVSADALGWAFFRIYDIYKKNKLSELEKKYFLERLQESIDGLLKNHTNESLAINLEKQTWMDSISREGARIEIQALRLFMYRILKETSKNSKVYETLETNTRIKVKRYFFNKNILADGSNDFTIRPNIFIAFYIYPELLSKDEWKKCFDKALEHLWLEWGGLSTIDRKDSRFTLQYTGEDPKSYHNGDSWYWTNNLAAISMHKLDKDYYKPFITKILHASSQEILYSGIMGHHAELSSANEHRSQGCLSQAWSSAMFIELINEVYGKIEK